MDGSRDQKAERSAIADPRPDVCGTDLEQSHVDQLTVERVKRVSTWTWGDQEVGLFHDILPAMPGMDIGDGVSTQNQKDFVLVREGGEGVDRVGRPVSRHLPVIDPETFDTINRQMAHTQPVGGVTHFPVGLLPWVASGNE